MSPKLAFAVAALLALAPAASAQDPPAPAKHVNKVTDAARAAFERMDKATYSPVAAGLKDLSGTLEMKVEGAGMGARPGMPGLDISFLVAFKVPSDLKVESKGEAQGPGRMMGDGMKKMATTLLRTALGLTRPQDSEEYDADAVVEGSKTVVTIIRYENGAETNRSSMTLDDRGLIESMTSTSKAKEAAPMGGPPGGMAGGGRGPRGGPPGGDEGGAMKFTWKKEGDRWLLEKMASQRGPNTFEITPVYTDAGGFKILTSWKMGGEGMGGGMSFGFRFAELAVNGKKVEIAAVAGKALKPGEDEDGEDDEEDEEHEKGKEGGEK